MGSSPTVQIIPCWGTFHGTVGALKSVRTVRLFILQQAKIFSPLVSVYGTKLNAGGKGRRTAEWGWALLDFLSFSFCFFLSQILFLVHFRTTKRAKLMNHREMASILS